MGEKSEGDQAFGMYRFFLRFIGVWALEPKSVFQTTRYVLAVAAKVTLALHTLAEILLNNGTISDMLDVFLFWSSAALALAKHTYLHVYKDAIGENLKCYLDDWDNTKDEQFLRIMRKHLKIYKYQFNIYTICGYAGVTLFMCRPVLANILAKRQLEPGEPYNYQIICQMSFLSQDTVAKYYPLIIAIQYIQFIYTCTSGGCTDCFFFGLVFHLCAQFEILKIKWERLGIEDFNSTDSDDAAREKVDVRSQVKELIDRHKQLVKLGENLEASFNRTILLQLLVSIVLISMSGCNVLVSILKEDYMTMLISINCINFMIAESLIYGYASDYLMTQSEDVVQAVYSSSWYNMEKRVKTSIMFVMMRAQIPLCITAGKFFYVTRNTILQLLKTTFSYLSVLRLTLEISHEEGQL